jgi:asparagine synthase (glutamine-hydrolysing)
MPSSVKLSGWETKHVLKRALRGRLPNPILERRKQGFGVPVARWLRGPLRPLLEETLAPERLRAVGLFDAERVAELVSEHLGDRRDHRNVLWSLLIFERWREAYLPDERWT